MTSPANIPRHLQSGIYNAIPKYLSSTTMIDALMIDEQSRLRLDGHCPSSISTQLKAFKSVLHSTSNAGLVDLAYETCIQNDRYDATALQAWIDRDGNFKITPLVDRKADMNEALEHTHTRP
jgi:hypothetical protein